MANNKGEFIRSTKTANSNTSEFENGHDEVDFIANNNNNNSINYDKLNTTTNNYNKNSANVPKKQTVPKSNNDNNNSNSNNAKQTQNEPNKPTTTTTTTPMSPTEPTTAASKHKNKDADKERKEPRTSLFSFSRKLSQKADANAEKPAPLLTTKSSPLLLPPTPAVPIGTPPRQHKFVKSSSLARLLGNTYNAKKFEREEQKRLAGDGKFNTFSGRRRNGPYLERFKRFSKEDGDVATSGDAVTVTGVITLTTDSRDLYGGSRSELSGTELPELAHHQYHHHHHIDDTMGAKAMRTLSRGLGKLWWKRTHSVDISTPDPEFKVSYLGNVLTGWAKGEGCVEKQLNTLWRNYTQNNKPDVLMRIKVCASGLKATTRQHGLTEYWANRITYCCAPKNYPRVVCWIYRHEGRKLKHELRCHAVLCSKEKIAQDICETLKENLESALREFKRDKILKQNARLSLANAVYDNPSLPRRKIMLSVGGNNYRPPLERSKSAPKLMAIEEAIGEEEGDEVEETNEPEMKPCCQKDSLYPAMTLGRRRCRRGHSIRRTGKTRPTFVSSQSVMEVGSHCCGAKAETKVNMELCHKAGDAVPAAVKNSKLYGSDGSDSDDFEKLLKYNNYDANTTLSTELLPYFDMQLHKNISQSLGSLSELKDHDDEEEPLSLLPTINSDPSADPEAEYTTTSATANGVADDADNVVAMRRDGVCSDGEEDYLDDADDMYFRQAAILNMLHRNSMRKMTNLSLSSDENSSIETNASAQLQYRHQQQSSISSNSSGASTTAAALAAVQDASSAKQRKQLNPDSDEGSISSGCETASTVTNNQDDVSLKYRQMQQQLSACSGLENVPCLSEYGILDEAEPTNATGTEVDLQDMYQRLESRLQQRHNSDATTYSSSSSITLKMGTSPATSVTALDVGVISNPGSINNSNNNTNTNNFSVSSNRSKRTRKHSSNRDQQQQHSGDSDSECSDESGYVEYQEQRKSGSVSVSANKPPHPPPKPMPRRLLNATSSAV